jgi:vacuolar protein sorting-associated protein 13A/C
VRFFIILKEKWNEKQEIQKDQVLKQQKLETYELLKAQKAKIEKEEKKSEDSGFIAKLTETVVNNLQVLIKNVHFRYEDTTDINVKIFF